MMVHCLRNKLVKIERKKYERERKHYIRHELSNRVHTIDFS